MYMIGYVKSGSYGTGTIPYQMQRNLLDLQVQRVNWSRNGCRVNGLWSTRYNRSYWYLVLLVLTGPTGPTGQHLAGPTGPIGFDGNSSKWVYSTALNGMGNGKFTTGTGLFGLSALQSDTKKV